MNLHRTTLLLSLVEGAPVPVDWPTAVGVDKTGVMRKTAYPAGHSDFDDEWPDTPEGRKMARAQASMFPSKPVKVGKTILKV